MLIVEGGQDMSDLFKHVGKVAAADTYEAAANSPHIEHLKANETEVLLLTDRIDEWLMSTLMQFKGKALINVAKEEFEESTKKPRVTKEKQEIIDKMKKSLVFRR